MNKFFSKNDKKIEKEKAKAKVVEDKSMSSDVDEENVWQQVQ